MSESLNEPAELDHNPSDILDRFAQDMRTYDELQLKKTPLLIKRDNILPIEGIDVNLDPIKHPPDVAYDALSKVILEMKIEEIENRENELLHYDSINYAFMLNLYGKEAELKALDPKRRKIGAFYEEYGDLHYAHRQYSGRKGRIDTLNLDVRSGGFINLRSSGMLKITRIFQAGPLIDRDNDYQPLFEINLV